MTLTRRELLIRTGAVAAWATVGGAVYAKHRGVFDGPPQFDRSAFPELTERELEILDLIAAGKNNAQIAAALYLAPKTVRNNVSNILAKLQATDRADAIIRARDAGLGGG